MERDARHSPDSFRFMSLQPYRCRWITISQSLCLRRRRLQRAVRGATHRHACDFLSPLCPDLPSLEHRGGVENRPVLRFQEIRSLAITNGGRVPQQCRPMSRDYRLMRPLFMRLRHSGVCAEMKNCVRVLEGIRFWQELLCKR